MEYIISQHASEQMTKIGISKAIVTNVLNQPNQIIRKANYTIYQWVRYKNLVQQNFEHILRTTTGALISAKAALNSSDNSRMKVIC